MTKVFNNFFRRNYIFNLRTNFNNNFKMGDSKTINANNVKKRIGTHNGTFHCDEVLACFMLQLLPTYSNSIIIRTRDQNLLDICDIVVDVGGVFNKEKNLFDHHQRTFNETLSSLRPDLVGDEFNKIRLSSAGLIYAYFGEDIIKILLKEKFQVETPTNEMLEEIFKKVYKYCIQEIDAIDNGIRQHEDASKNLYSITTDLTTRILQLNPAWNSLYTFDVDAQFNAAKRLAGNEFLYKVEYFGTAWWPARDIVTESFKNPKNIHESGDILELKTFCPWKEHVLDLETKFGIAPKYVIYRDSNNNWCVECVPIELTNTMCRQLLYETWHGKRKEELRIISGIEDATFCHKNGVIGGAKSREGVRNMAIKSLQLNQSQNVVKKRKLN